MEDNKKIFTHPSYAMISFSRYTGSNSYMFGSELNHNGGIRLRICNAEKHRHLGRDWYHSRDVLIEVNMSYSQFAEAITNMNTTGVPCTLDYHDGKQIEPCPKQSNEITETHEEFEKLSSKIASNLNECINMAIEQLNSPKPTTKKEKQALIDSLKYAKMNIESNMPFVIKSFNENIDTTVSNAKAEVEGFVTQRITQMGIEGIKQQMLSVGDKNDE